MFFLWYQSINSFIPMRRMRLWCLITKRKEIIMWNHVCQNRPTNINSKNGRKRSFSFEIKGSIPFIQTRRMNLWFPIIKRKEIIMWIHVYPIEKWTLILQMVEIDIFPMKPKLQFIYPCRHLILSGLIFNNLEYRRKRRRWLLGDVVARRKRYFRMSKKA